MNYERAYEANETPSAAEKKQIAIKSPNIGV